jgi:hypothetical protein
MKVKSMLVGSVIVALLASCATLKQERPLPMVRIVDFGIYKGTIVGVKENPDAPMGSTLQTDNLKLIEMTTTVRMEKNVEFGIRYALDEAEVGQVEIVRKVIHPGFYDPHTKRSSTEYVSKKTLKAGETYYQGYKLEEDFEMVPGAWSFQLWYQNTLIARKDFVVSE